MVAQATDKQGRPVTMLINPDSVTTVTAVNAPGMGSGSKSDNGSSASAQ